MERFDSAGAYEDSYTYHADYIGSVRYLTDSAGNVVNAYEYDSYGRPVFEVEAAAQPFRYTGREYDAASGLYHYRARTYDSSTGRFLQEDPIGFLSGDLNLYRYGLSNPITFSDALGLTASGEYAGAGRTSSGLAGPAATIGSRISCVFTALAAGLELAGQPDLKTIDLIIVGTDVGQACGAKATFKKPKKTSSTCGGKNRCFAAGTLVHTRDGLKPIEDIVAGDEVKSMNPQTGEIAYSHALLISQ